MTETAGASGYAYWRGPLGGGRRMVAPMVEQSELAWRLLSRRYGGDVCFTPMLHASVFAKDPTYRKDNFVTCAEDRPLVVQFCGNEADTLLEACQALPAGTFDGVDINLGCPQLIAKRGFYGAFLGDRRHWPRVRSIVERLHRDFPVPVSCKIRVFPDVETTVEFARMLEAAGCQLLTVHGRTREMKGPETGVADWDQIAAVKAAVAIPVVANGNIQYFEDLQRCMDHTKVDAVMTAEGNLHNPGILVGGQWTVWDIANEYLEICRQYPTAVSSIRGHLFKIFHHVFIELAKEREACARANVLEDFQAVVTAVKAIMVDKHEEWEAAPSTAEARLPPWICQPYVRPGNAGCSEEATKVREAREGRRKRQHEALQTLSQKSGLSKRRLRKMAKSVDQLPDLAALAKARAHTRVRYVKCDCGNPVSTGCEQAVCRKCCLGRCREAKATCEKHRFFCDPLRPRPVRTPAEGDSAEPHDGKHSPDSDQVPDSSHVSL